MDELQKKVPSRIFKKLSDAKFDSLKSILSVDKLVLRQNTKLSSRDVDVLLEVVASILSTDKIRTAFEVPDWPRISTGCDIINSAIHGGVPINGITEIYGNSGVGKTQFCLQLSLMVQLPRRLGGVAKGAVYICTEDIFPSKRLNQLTKVFPSRFSNSNIDTNFEDNVYLEHISNFEQLRRCLYVRVPNLLSRVKIGLLIIDSIAGAFRSNNENVNYATRKENFIELSSKLHEICENFGVAILCTNQVSDNVQNGQSEPALGLAWSNVVTSRFKMHRNFNNPMRYFEVVVSPDSPNTTCKFIIKDCGIVGIN